jgi:uncharacterized protein
MQQELTVTAFHGVVRLAQGSRAEVAPVVREAETRHGAGTILVFDDWTGRQVELELREGGEAPEPPRKAGRPKLGVVSREVTLLPRQWEWLNAQPGGASVTLRKLVDAARNANGAREARRRAQEAADNVMRVLAGDAPNYEDASRALYAGDYARFTELSETWPGDVRDHVRRLAEPAFDWPDR